MKKRIVITAEIPSVAREILREFDVAIEDSRNPRTEDDLIEVLRGAAGAITLLSDPMTRRVIEALPELEVVSNYAVGVNNIDLDAARENGVMVANTPDVLTAATADLTMALILAVTRRLIEGDAFVRSGRFSGWDPLLLLGMELEGKRLGIVGLGRIGEAVARRASSFGMQIVFHTRHPRPQMERGLGAAWLTLDELLRTSDVVTIHTPLTRETRGLVDREALFKMKVGSYLINTSRGEIVDETALCDALEQGRLRGAGLDVFEREPLVEPRLLDMEHVVLLPHIGSATEEARRRMAEIAARNILSVLQGSNPIYEV